MIPVTPKVFTVTQLNSYIGGMVASDPMLQTRFIEGELSNIRLNAQSGHLYFSLKDKQSVVRAVMFSWAVKNLRFRPEDGMKVIMRAQVTVYEPMGQYQLKVEDMQPDGVGVLAMQLEQLKKKLSAEGLFDKSHKKAIPRFPNTVGVITSPTGAALRDIMDILGRRYPCVKVILAPTLVQGEGAPAQLVKAVETFSNNRLADVIIIGRGGGSMEDLWAFNSEELARAIYRCEIPVISAVGHETDVTICDFVSDLRAPTPSAAAELAVPDKAELIENLSAVLKQGESALSARISLYESGSEKMAQLISAKSPMPAVESYSQLVDAYAERSDIAADNMLRSFELSSRETFSKVEALNPAAILDRGYSYVHKDGINIKSVEEVTAGDFIEITFCDGKISAIVTE